MKRKLFLSLMVGMVLAVLLAIGVGAEITIYDDAPAKTNITVTTDDVVVFSDGFSCPTGYISSDATSTSNGWNGALTVKELFDFSYINGKTGKNYGFGDIVSVDIPQGVTYIGGYGITGATNLKRISFPDTITGFGGWLLMDCTSLEECVFEHDENDAFTNLCPGFFANCPNLKAISLPDCITSFGWNNTSLDGEYFRGCTSLGAIHLPKNLQIMYGQTDDKSVFGNLTNVYFVNEAFTYENIPSKPDIYYFPSGLATMSGTVFKGCKNLNSILVFGESTTSITRGNEFESAEVGNGAKPIIVFLGDTTSINVTGWNVTAVYFANENDVDSATSGASGSAAIYYCNAAANTNHLVKSVVNEPARCEINAAEVTTCFCGYEIRSEVNGTALSHDYNYSNGNATLVSYAYVSFDAEGTKIVACANCGENAEFSIAPLFSFRGFSAAEYVDGGISIGYTVNYAEISEYEKITGEAVSYGVFAVAKDNIKNNDIFDANGQAQAGVIAADITESGFNIFNLKIVGFTNEQTDVKLAMGAYVGTTADGVTEYSYMQGEAPSEGEKYFYASYSDVVAIVKLKEEAAK